MSSKRGRPARKFDANRIIEIVMDLYANEEYLNQFKHEYSNNCIEEFQDFLKEFHQKLAMTSESTSMHLTTEEELNEVIKVFTPKDTDSEEDKLYSEYIIPDTKASIPVLSDDDIEEFQTAIGKLPQEVWKTYSGRLRQKKHKKKNSKTNITVSDTDYDALSYLKRMNDAKTWSELFNKLYDENQQLSQVLRLTCTSNLPDAIARIQEILDMFKSINIHDVKYKTDTLLDLYSVGNVEQIIEKVQKDQSNES